MKGSRLVLLALSIVSIAHAAAEAPVSVARPKEARGRIAETALSYAGSPYVYGGKDPSGFDCSGLVYRVYREALGAVLPRTAREQYAYSEPIDASEIQIGDLVFFDTAGPISHVGIYEGEGRFVHAASEGPKKGVVESSLSEAYWAKAFSAAGRIIPPAEYLGLIFSASLGPSFGAEDFLRGIRGSFGVAYAILGVETGLELRPEYDASLGVFRLPAVLALGIDRKLKAFAGPALTLGSPNLGGSREYEARGGILATVGLEYTPFSFRVGTRKLGLGGELVYDHYVSEEKSDFAKDAAARIRVGLFLSTRWGI